MLHYTSKIFPLFVFTFYTAHGCIKKTSKTLSDVALEPPKPRRVWLKKGEVEDPSIANIVSIINDKTGFKLDASEFKKDNEVEQAHSNYIRFDQMKDCIFVDKSNIRIWTDLATGIVLQVDAYVTDSSAIKPETPDDFVVPLRLTKQELASQFTNNQILGTRVNNVFIRGQTIRRIEVASKKGYFTFDYAAKGDKIISRKFRQPLTDETYFVDAKVYPIYEKFDPYFAWPTEVSEAPLERQAVRLENILSSRKDVDWSVTLNAMSQAPFLYSKGVPDGSVSLEDQAKGFWNQTVWNDRFPSYDQQKGNLRPNLADGNIGSIAHLIGKNVGIFIHPKAGIATNEKTLGGAVVPVGGSRGDDFFVFPKVTFLGRTFNSPTELKTRVALGEKNEIKSEDTAWLIKQGFDEVQVYYAVDRFMEKARALGFTDKGLSTKPFSAILYDPDIEFKNNAFYWFDTINFTTYSKGSLNYARDNTTIWHELGHGLQDRLMASWSAEAVSGLSEGMADLLGELILYAQIEKTEYPGNKFARIRNHTWFNATNESHDDGEAYGGAMNDMTIAAIKRWGHKEGLSRAADLILETMRFTRDHPIVSQDVWFESMLYVDTLDRPVTNAPNRKAGDLNEIINNALISRNFSPGKVSADMKVTLGDNEVLTSESLGSFSKPMEFKADGSRQKVTFKVSLTDGETTKFKFPITLRIVYFRIPASVGAIPFDGWEQKSKDFTFTQSGEEKEITQEFTAKCDFSNSSSGGCSGELQVQAFNEGEALENKPLTKKRIKIELK